jgi:hypothetical protein
MGGDGELFCPWWLGRWASWTAEMKIDGLDAGNGLVDALDEYDYV